MDISRQTPPAVLVFYLGLATLAAGCSSKPELFTTPSPTETHALNGRVRDATTGAYLPSALIEARTDPDESQPVIAWVMSGPSGRYRIAGLPPGVIYIRVQKSGYQEITERIDLTATGSHNFAIAWDPNLSYTLTIEADCSSSANPLSPELRRGTFIAQIEQMAEKLTVRAHSAMNRWNVRTFYGQKSDSGATFALTCCIDEFGAAAGEDVVEYISAGSGIGAMPELVFLGEATTTSTATGFSGILDGTITFYPVKCYPCMRQPSTGSCRGGRFEFAR